jgi:hypothetical protein
MAKKQVDSIAPLGGMDQDSDARFIQDGDYIYILNGIRYGVGEDGVTVNAPGNDTAENVASTFLADNTGGYIVDDYGTIAGTELDGDLPPGKIVGHCKDPKRNGIIIFLKGGEGSWSQSVSGSMADYSSIYEFFAAGEIYVPILKNDPTIDFEKDIVEATVINDRLYWLERGKQPRTINLIKAYNHTHGDKEIRESVTVVSSNENGLGLAENVIPSPFSEFDTDRVYITVTDSESPFYGNEYKVTAIYEYSGVDYIWTEASDEDVEDQLATDGSSLSLYKYIENTYIEIRDDVVSLIKKPPLYTIEIEYGYDSDFPGSNVFDKVFQFRQQYIYEDSLKSSFSNTSKVAFNSGAFSIDNTSLSTTNTNNFVDVSFNSGDETIEKIKIVVREGNIGTWYEVAVIDKDTPVHVIDYSDMGSESATYKDSLSDSTNYAYRFYNTGGYRAVDNNEVDKAYENIPITSNHMTSLGNNRLVFGQNQEDYESIDVDGFSMSPRYNNRPSEPYYVSSYLTSTIQNTSEIKVEITYRLNGLPSTLTAGTVVVLKCYAEVSYTISGETYKGFLPDPGGKGTSSINNVVDNFAILDSDVSKDVFGNNILDYITFNYDTDDDFGDKGYFIEDDTRDMSYDSFSYDDEDDLLTIVYVYDTGETVSSLSAIRYPVQQAAWNIDSSVKRTLKRGRHGQGAIQYLDKYGRAGEPLVSNESNFFVKEYGDDDNKGSVNLNFSVNYTPPVWAHHYRFLLSYQKRNFIQVPILYSLPHLNEQGGSAESIALMLGLTVDVLQDVVEDDIDSLEKQVEELRGEKKTLDNAVSSGEKYQDSSALERFFSMKRISDSTVDANKKRLDNVRGEISDLERQIELKKYELTNLYARALENVKQYRFSKGDRIRIIKAGNTNSDSLADYDTDNYTDNVFDLKVIDVKDSIDYTPDYESESPTTYSGLWLIVKPPNQNGFTKDVSFSKWDNALIEVYKPNYSNRRNMFYETPEIFDISNPGTDSRSHGTSSSYIEPNDCYYRLRSFATGSDNDQLTGKGEDVMDWVEDPHITHDFKSDSHDIGRVFIKNNKERGQVLPSIIYTNNHLEGTEINGLSQADYDNVEYLSEEYGDIFGLNKRGDTLKVYQAKKITSFYPQDGNVLGRMRKSQTDYGTVYPKSMVDTPYGARYGFDVYNGVVWRDLNNGVFNVSGRSVSSGKASHYKMGSFFKKLAEDIRDNGIDHGSDDVIAAYDEQYELVYFSFLHENLDTAIVPYEESDDGSKRPYRTFIFHEPTDRWVGMLDIAPTGYAYGYNTLLSSYGGDVWVHNREDQDRCNFYGNQRDFEAKFVSNAIPNIRKIFDTMHVHITTDGFSIPELTVPTDNTNKNGQLSYLNSNHFKLEDGIHAAPILNDITSKDGTESTRDLYMGDKMRGYTMTFKLKSSATSQFELFKVDVYFRPKM